MEWKVTHSESVGEEIDVGIVGIAGRSEFFERREMFFAAAHGIVEFRVAVVADSWEISAIEERAVVGEFGTLVAIAETARGVRNLEIHAHGFVGFERLIERVDGVEMFFVGERLVEGAIEAQFVDGFAAVGDVNGFDGLAGVIYEHVVAGGGEGTALGENIHRDINVGDFRLRQALVFFVELFVIGGAMAGFLIGAEFIQHVRVVIEPAAAGGGQQQENYRRGNQTAKTRPRQTQTRGPGKIRASSA